MFSYKWLSRIDTHQIDTCDIEFRNEGLRAHGEQRTGAYVARWQLTALSDWTTSCFSVTVQGKNNWSRKLHLRRADTEGWSSSISASGNQPAELPAPGFDAKVDLSNAIDIDLGRCPMTNTMPIRRLGLLENDVPRTPLIMAWIDMPSLRVIASDQYYSSVSRSSVRYESGTRDVNVLLKVDANGVVLDYPDLARCVSTAHDSRPLHR